MQNNYQVMTNVSGLDTKKGFDVELNVTRRNNNVENSKFETVDTYNVSYGPGELTPDSKIFDESGENPGAPETMMTTANRDSGSSRHPVSPANTPIRMI